MAKVALYRKYRPQNFDELYGQDHIAQTLKNSIKSGSFSHAYLFCGPRGTGKTSVARILARAINCESNNEGNPDNACTSCKQINEDKTMDIIEIDAASHTQVDNIREIIVERANFAPTNLKYKVYIIDEAHMLSKSSFNALLKTLEEPPEHAIFILATTEVNKIIPTIVSRCQRFDFRRINSQDMAKRLKYICEQEKIQTDEKVISMIVEIAEGGFRDAISLLDQLSSSLKGKITAEEAQKMLGLTSRQIIEDLAYSLAKRETEAALELISKQIEMGLDVQAVQKNLIEYYRKLLLVKVSGKNEIEMTENEQEKISKIVIEYQLESILRDIDILIQTQNMYKHASMPQLGLEVAIVKICSGFTAQKEVVAEKAVSKPQASAPVKQDIKAVPVNASDQVKWQQTLLEIKSKNNSIHAFLKVCDPEFDDEVIKLHFPYKFHKERIEDTKNRQIVEAALTKILGKNYRIKCTLKPLATVPQVSEAKKDDLLEDALEIFGGEVIE